MIKAKHLEKLWKYIKDMFEDELEEVINEFEFDTSRVESIDMLSDDEILDVASELVYMALNGFYSGDFDTMYETLTESIKLPKSVAEELLDW